MIVPIWVHETAALFWEAAGACEPFPRGLRDPIHRSPFEVTIKEIRGLSTDAAECYLAQLSPGWVCCGPMRGLRACLAARDGAGFILLEADDSPADRVFSLAHELAHFLWHYWRPRERASKQLGRRAAEVFDGKRAPSNAEWLRALLANVPLGPHVHLMERGTRPGTVSERVAVIEEEADRLAYELLAPADAVASQSKEIWGAGSSRSKLAALLQEVFGFPKAQAEGYRDVLLPTLPVDPLLRRLGKKT